ncbi:MAG: hypothetical protein NTU44_16380 [Bacteroidetes bacterium]|nr:hypothetical protein [Bacteroidota bacterium]
MENKVLIIEDSDIDFSDIFDSLSEYDVLVYPDRSNFDNFSDLLDEYARKKSTTVFENIKNIIIDFKPNFVLLDIGLNHDDPNDKTGLELQKSIIDKELKNCDTIIISSHSYQDKLPYIRKKSAASIKGQIEEKLIKKFGIPMKPNVTQEKNDFNIHKPKILLKFGDFEAYKILPWATFALDKIVTYSFYVLLITLFLAAPINVIIKIFQGDELIQIAEFTFIAFLPFLITSGFLIFYTKSLKPYILQETVDDDSDNFDSSSNLMRLTKKLFVSSLLSYLFIKLIELLCFEKPTMKISIFQEFYKISNPFVQFYILIGFIIILILYYIYMDKDDKLKHFKTFTDE